MFRGEQIFSAKSSGELICVEAATGKQLWESAKVTGLKLEAKTLPAFTLREPPADADRSILGSCKVSSSAVPAGFAGAARRDYHLAADPANQVLRRAEPNPAVAFDLDDDPRPAGGRRHRRRPAPLRGPRRGGVIYG